MKKNSLLKILFIIILLNLCNESLCQINLEWFKKNNIRLTNAQNNPSNNCIAIDSSSNTYITAIVFDSTYKGQLLITKYNSAGDSVWSCIYKLNLTFSVGDHTCYIKSDGNNIYVASRYADSTDKNQIILLKYNTAGTLLWDEKYHNPENGNDYTSSMIIDKSGFIYITGYSDEPGGINMKCVVLKYKENGNLIWARRVSTGTFGIDIIADDTGNVYIAGSIYMYAYSKTFMMAAKYDSSGVLKWLKDYGINSNGYDGAHCIALDDSNNVIVGGTTCYTYDWYYTTVKYRNNGEFVWVKANSQSGSSIVKSIATDSRCNIYVTGSGQNSLLVKYDCMGNQKGSLIPTDYYTQTVKPAGGKYLYVAGSKDYDTLSRTGFYFAKLDTNLTTVFNIYFLIDSAKYVWTNSFVNDKNGNIFLGGGIRYVTSYPPYDVKYPIVFKLSQTTGIQNISNSIISNYHLYQNYPNPFNPSTKIKFDLRQSSNIKLIIYNILGKEIAKLVNEKLDAGIYEVDWPAPSGEGSNYPSGIYFYKLTTDGFTDVKKMILIK